MVLNKSKIKHGIAMLPPDPATYSNWCGLAENHGFEMIWIPDSQSLYRELYVSATICSYSTNNILFGPCVTNPVTRHPAVAASGMSTLNELSGGRAVFGIATGDSALLNLGLRPSLVEELREYIISFRELVEKGSTVFEGNSTTLSWNKSKVPVYMAAEGIKTLRLAGEVADGVIIGTGFVPEMVADSLTWIEEGARKSGRKLEDLDLWWIVKVNVNDDGEQAKREIRMALAGSANHAFRFTKENKHIPTEFLKPIRILEEKYLHAEHEMVDKRSNADLVDELGLREYLLDRFSVAGTPSECQQRLKELEKMGVQHLRITAHVPDRPLFIKNWSEAVRKIKS
ncbi:MAG: LLM class flavin-dependent oxidoreductase [Nitrospinota bacterium]|nr:LLM class flavin-dependent oxidoreductase [Nitrospinota bacterium]